MSDLRAGLNSILSWWKTAGVEIDTLEVPKPKTRKPALKERPKAAQKPDARPMTKTAAPKSVDISALREKAAAAPTREALFKAIADLDAGELSLTATQPVFFRGNPEAKIMAIGEAPGAKEDRQGKPFVGKSGQLLDRIFASIGLGEEDIYITNVVNFRPPGNRKPTGEEIELFRPFIRRHVELIAPDFLIFVGGVSLEAMSGITGIMKNRGQWLDYDIGNGKTIPALPVYHPAFLLRRPELKADMWRDMLSLKGKLEG